MRRGDIHVIFRCSPRLVSQGQKRFRSQGVFRDVAITGHCKTGLVEELKGDHDLVE